jgi:hypothetical protein
MKLDIGKIYKNDGSPKFKNMSKQVLIETYKGVDIYFCLNRGEFYVTRDCRIDEKYYQEYFQPRTSYKGLKQRIEAVMKEVESFEPIKVMKAPTPYDEIEEVYLVGTTVDYQFMCEDSNGKRRKMRVQEENEFFVCHKINDLELDKIKRLKEKRSEIDDEIIKLSDSLIKEFVSELRLVHINKIR